MQQHQFERLVDDTLLKCREHLVMKGHEYGGSDDRLAQFKRSAGLTGCTPLQVALAQASQHYDAIATLVRDLARGEHRGADSIEQRFDDLINHTLLMKALVTDVDEVAPSRTAEPPRPVQRGGSAIQRQAEVVVTGPAEPVLKAER